MSENHRRYFHIGSLRCEMDTNSKVNIVVDGRLNGRTDGRTLAHMHGRKTEHLCRDMVKHVRQKQ